MAQKPVVVGDVYLLGGEARLKISVSVGGVPAVGLFPTVTVIRDSDNFGADFIATTFAATTPITIDEPRFRTTMTDLGVGVYYYDFDPVPFGDTTEQVYTVIFRNGTTDPYTYVEKSEFTFSNTLAGKVSTGFGMLNRQTNVCKNVPMKFSYQALPGQTDVKITIYDPNDNLLVTNAVMSELGMASGIYQFEFTPTMDGEHVAVVAEASNGSTDGMVLTVGGDADRLKRIEQLLLQLNLTPPSVGPCP